MSDYRIQESKAKNDKLPSIWSVVHQTYVGETLKTTGICVTVSKEWALKIAGALSMLEDQSI